MYGGIASGIDYFTGGNKPEAPNMEAVAPAWNAMMNVWQSRQGDTYANEAQYQPLYAGLGTGIVAQQAPNIMQTLRQYNPGQTGLVDTLTGQAQSQLGLNGALDTATRRGLQQNIRGAQASRGLGYGPGDAGMEAYYLTQTQEQRRRENQNLASGVAGVNQSMYGNPFSWMQGIQKTPAITSSEMANSMLGTTYNAQASTDIANQNARSGAINGIGSY